MAADIRKHLITTTEELEAVFSEPPLGNALTKEIDHVNATYRALIEAAPFFALATNGPEGLDCSPRGDPAGFVRVADEKTLLIPDRRGNNRIDSLRNIVRDPRVALLFLIPGCGETLRINGSAAISTDPKLTQSFIVEGKAPKVVLVVTVDRIYYQCPKAIVRSKIWDTTTWIDRKTLPTSGKILADITRGKVDAEAHDRDYPARLKATIYGCGGSSSLLR
ncbi:MAG TPA: pyridoxamine 5'-phosphate oxidase family protein [Xanthobacteraceae bacterium]|nr:pyridoxamine 5'-phosphate oxidase family protein [Xanthobacteraceae bacterium]